MSGRWSYIRLTKMMEASENLEINRCFKIPILFSRSLAVPVTETIKKLAKGENNPKDMSELLLSTFEVKRLDRFYLDTHDFILEKNVTEPTLREGGVHKMILTLDSGRFSGGQKLFGESFEISLDVEILDEEGLMIECISNHSALTDIPATTRLSHLQPIIGVSGRRIFTSN